MIRQIIKKSLDTMWILESAKATKLGWRKHGGK
jgi:hypothetical protein